MIDPSASTSIGKRAVRYGVILAAALLCACSSHSWKSSSALRSSGQSKVGAAGAVDEYPAGGQSLGTPASPQRSAAGTSGASASPGAGQASESAGGDDSAGLTAYSEDDEAEAAIADEIPPSDASGAATADGALSAMDREGATAVQDAGMPDFDAGRAGFTDDSAGADRSLGFDRASGATAETAAADASAGRSAASDAQGVGTIPGAAGDTARAGSAAASSIGPEQGESAASRAQEEALSREVVVGMVEAPGKKATATETVIPQTLGGMLPLTLGVEGEGEFDFDKAILREQVKTVLDELAERLRDAEYDRLEIVGHADRIGTDDYNQYLSERRAWAVARYLVKQGVPAAKLAVEGRGTHEPLTDPDQCKGLSRDEMIACLQPDRRVVISASIRKVDVHVQ
jgi:outer membrane protein OmpA-like peptidoglycan-associated protein